MKAILIVLFLITAQLAHTQSYVDSGIRHFNLGEYDEALVDFESVEEIKSMLTESSKAKVHFYTGSIWLSKAEKAGGNTAEQDALQLAYDNLSLAMKLDTDWEDPVKKAFRQLNTLLLSEADSFIKQEKKADGMDEKTSILDRRIDKLLLVKEIGISSLVNLYLGQTNKQAGDIIFNNTTNVLEMQKAQKYYEESLKYYELARYDDPFSKDIIEALLTISTRLGDVDRIAEYEKLMELADG